ncbi:MAG: hypothetical protein R6X14_07060 [bacterium]
MRRAGPRGRVFGRPNPVPWCCFAVAVLAVAGAVALPLSEAGIDSLLRGRTAWQPRPLPEGQAPPRGARTPAWRFPNADSVIKDDFVCNDDATGGCRQSRPRVAVAGDGSFVVTWYGFTAGETDVWYQRFDPSGRPVGENRTANGDSSMRWQGDPAVAVRADGSFLITWEDRWRVGDSDIFAQLFAPDGSERGRNFRVSDSGVAGDQMANGVWISPSGLTLATWDDRRYGITGDIFAQFLDGSGQPLDTNFRINDDGVGVGNQYLPVVGGDDEGRFAVAWMDGRTGSWNVFAQRFGPDRGRLGTNIQVTSQDSIQWSPAIGVSPGGGFLVCWEDRRRAQWDVYARVYDETGRPAGESFRVSTDPGDADQFSCAAAGNRHDEFLAVWTDRRAGYEEIGAQRYRSDGTPLGVNFLVSDWGPAPAGRGEPAAAARPDGGYVVAWVDGADGHLDVYARLLARDGMPLGTPFRVNTDSASSLQRVPSLDMYADGRVLVAWEDERNGSADIYSVLLAPDGQPVGANLRLADDVPGAASQYYAAAAAGRNRSLVTWTDGRDGFNIFGQFLDSFGDPRGGNFRVNTATAGHRWYSYTAMDEADRATVVWMDTRQGGYRVYARRFRPDGQPAGEDFAVGDEDVNQYYASVAAGRTGRVVAAWMDYRDGSRPDIYCQLFDTSGTRLGGNLRVNDDAGDGYHGYPAAAVADDGSFVVAWEDTRNDAYDVYLQWFDAERKPVGGNVRVNDAPVGPDAYSPSCAFDRQGRLVVLFNDEREQPRNPQVYVQRFRPDRSRISRNQKFNQPNAAPRNHHWNVGRSIAASDEVVAATWTGNRRLQGWDVYAKFTDWNLIGIAERTGPGDGPAPGAFRVFPSVSPGGRFTVAAPAGELRLYDTGGRLRRLFTVEAGPIALDLGDLPGGVYILEATDGERRRSLKLVIPDRRAR